MSWLRPIDLGQIIQGTSLKKLVLIGCFGLTGAVLFVGYLVWSKPATCHIENNRVEAGGVVTCTGDAKPVMPRKEEAAKPAPDTSTQQAFTIAMASFEERFEAATRAIQARQAQQQAQRFVYVEIREGEGWETPKPKKPRARAAPSDPMPARTIRIMPDSDAVSALSSGKWTSEHSCLIDKFEACWMSVENRKRVIVKIPIDDYLHMLNGGGIK